MMDSNEVPAAAAAAGPGTGPIAEPELCLEGWVGYGGPNGRMDGGYFEGLSKGKEF